MRRGNLDSTLRSYISGFNHPIESVLFYVRAKNKVNTLMFDNKNKTSLSSIKEAISVRTTGILHAVLMVPDFIWHFPIGITTFLTQKYVLQI